MPSTATPATAATPSARERIATAAGPAELAAILQAERDRIQAENARRPAGRGTCRALAERTDWAIQRLFHLATRAAPAADANGETAAGQSAPRLPERSDAIAIAATDGYGGRLLS